MLRLHSALLCLLSLHVCDCRHPVRPMRRGLTVRLAIAVLSALSTATTAFADFQVCNDSEVDVDLSHAYHHVDFRWTSEGWWSMPMGKCVTLYRGDLRTLRSLSYLYAIGGNGRYWSARPDQKGGWFCVRQQKFVLHNRDYVDEKGGIDCDRASLTAKQFLEVNFGNGSSYTLHLTPIGNKLAPRPLPTSAPSPLPSPGAGAACERFPNLC
jgi:uncharacterized membrane protein